MTPEQTLDWLAEQHKSQCNEDRPVQEWIRSMKSMLPAPVACLSKPQAKAILDLALELEKTGRIIAMTEGQERSDFVAKNRNIQCALEDALRNATAPQPAPVQEQMVWKNAAIRLGEELSSVGPDGYYDMTAKQWLDWAMNQQPRGKNSLPAAQRQWVGLTDEERLEVAEIDGADEWFWKVCKAIEAKLKEKNT